MEKPRQLSRARDRRRRYPVTLGAEHPTRKPVRNDKRCILAETPMSSGWVMNSHSSPLFFYWPRQNRTQRTI
ncbi:hypothetical protein HID58_075020 [Brassica napus]|uniref:Uncharacterized protein n=1 Tax=Brassica napus TaxID=3708 RepID=A0ABQ7YIP7_BRANA|nr:hypothetical protein HID58_075020 [Brassica napus]